MKQFKAGDEVILTQGIGRLPAGSRGLVVEVYEAGLAGGEQGMDALFDYAAVFPAEVDKILSHNGTWLRTNIIFDQFHAGDAVPVRESELSPYIEGVEPKRYQVIPRDAVAVKWDATTGREGAKALAKWLGGEFVYDDTPGQEDKTYYWSIQVFGGSGITFIARPGEYLLRYADGGIGVMNSAAFISTYQELEK